MTWGRRHTDDRGAVTAEFVIIFPLFMILILGMMSLGIGWYHQQSMVSATREGARIGATYPTSEPSPQDGVPNDAWFEEVWTATNAGALTTWEQMCIAYVGRAAKLPDSAQAVVTQRRIYQNNSIVSPTVAAEPCFDDGRGTDERRVQVVLQRPHNFWVFNWSEGITLAGRSVTRIEMLYPQ